MVEIIPKLKIDKLMVLPGEVRGVAFQTTIEFILKEKGKEGLVKLEKTMVDLGYPVKQKEIKPMDFYL